MNLTIACAYCRRQIVLKLASPLVVNGRGAQIGPPVKCDACGSTTQLEISTKRVRKGKAMRDIEARAAAKLAALVSMCRARNAAIGAKLLEQPGCTCAKRHEDYPGHSMRHDGVDGGHFLSTGWSRDSKAGGMLPTLPHHYAHCDCYGTDEERRILGTVPLGSHSDAVNTTEEHER